MGINIVTNRPTQYKELSLKELENIISLIFRSNYNSYFHFAYNDKTGDKEKFVGYGGSISCQSVDEDFFDDGLPKNVDIYICPNGMKSPFKRSTDKLISIQNLVIDIDSHEKNADYNVLNKHIKQVEEILLNKLEVKPNLINRTGRGMHLWYWIEPCHESLSKICLNVSDMILTNIQEILSGIDTTLKIDKKASTRLGGLFRLPYSYNTAAQRWSEVDLIHEDTPNINDIKNILTNAGYKPNKENENEEKESKKKSNSYKFSRRIKSDKYAPLLIKRKKFIDYIYKNGNHYKRRDLIIFNMYNVLVWLMDQEDAESYCLNMNDGFEEPLSYAEMCSIMKRVNKKRYDRVTTEGFFKLINATEDEIAWYNSQNAKKQKKIIRQQTKKAKYDKVRELYNNGIAITQISRDLKISRPTIYKIINEDS